MIINPGMSEEKKDSVTSFNGRTGAIAPQSGDYTADMVGALASEGTATAATKLATSRTIRTNLGSTSSASFNGTANVTPGVTGVLPTTNGGTGNNSGYIRAGQQGGTTIGSSATAEGYDVTANGSYSHAEGRWSKAEGVAAHAEGQNTIASGDFSHAEGGSVSLSGTDYKTTASGYASHAEGAGALAAGEYSHSAGYLTIARASSQTAIGVLNKESTTKTDKLIVGKGTSATNRANCFRVTDTGVYATGAHNTTGADYAELFEWLDGNPDKADRCGRFVTLDGEKIRLAGPGDDFILGIVSGNPSVVGDVHDDQWQGMYLYDVFGRPLWEDVEVPDVTVEAPDPEDPESTVTHVIIPAHIEHRQRLNPAYDGSQPYQPRTQRPEWDAVGMLGKLVAVDDGTCQAGGWCTVGEGGAATYSAARTRYRVMARLDERHVRVLIL